PDETPIESALRHPPDTVLGQLRQRDLSIIFLESFGAMLYDDPQAAEATAAARGALYQAITASGRSVVTAFYRSPTIGGASDLAHMSVLSGVDLSDPRRHDLLLTTGRPTLIQLLQTKGYEAFGLYHAVSWPWPERVFYRFDHYLDGPSLGYRGPPLGFWSIPDQFAIARFMDLHPIGPETPPRLLLFPTITSHFPFSPVPPYQPDWRQVLTEKPFGDNDTEIALAERPNWRNMRPDYLRMVNYVYQWLSGFFLLPESRDTVYLLIGDHQPTANVSGEGVTWDVPVHIISRDRSLLQPLISAGFSEGLNAARAAQGGLHELPALLLQVWSTPAPGRP
ncbi:MAG: sulfatase-like hydrolase/transferase, partial [Burkholderiaceae bacterium]